MNHVEIAYGRGHLNVKLPPDTNPTLIRKTSLPKLADQAGAVR